MLNVVAPFQSVKTWRRGIMKREGNNKQTVVLLKLIHKDF